MPTSDFLDFIAQPTRGATILAEIEPHEAITDWAFRIGSVYTHTWTPFVGLTEVPGGLYRNIIAISDGGVLLRHVTDLGVLAGTPGTWFYNPIAVSDSFKLGGKLGHPLGRALADEELLIHTTDSTDPATKTMIRVTFRLHFGTQGEVHDNIYYEPRLTGEELPTTTQETEDLFFGIAKKVASGSITLSNTDALFDKLAAEWVWKDARVTLFIGGDDLLHQAGGGLDYIEVGQFLIESFVPALEIASIQLRDVQKITLRQLPPNFFSSAIYPELESGKEGAPIPLLFGASSGPLSAVRISGDGTNQDTNVYVIADASLQTLFSIGDIYSDGVVISTDVTEIQKSPTGCTFSIGPGLGETNSFGVVTVDAIGQPIQGDPWETSGDYLKHYGEIISYLYTTILGLTIGEIDAATALSVDGTESAPQALHLTSQKTARVVIRDIERGVLGRTVRRNDGKLAMTIWQPGIDAGAVRSIADPEILEFEPRRRIGSVYSKINVEYDLVPSLGSFKVTFTENLRTKFLNLDDRDVELALSTLLTTGVAAKRLANRVALMTEVPDVVVRIVETGIRLMDQKVGDRVFVTLSRAPSLTGDWTNEIFEIDKIVKRLAPIPQVEVTLHNQRGIGLTVGEWLAL